MQADNTTIIPGGYNDVTRIHGHEQVAHRCRTTGIVLQTDLNVWDDKSVDITDQFDPTVLWNWYYEVVIQNVPSDKRVFEENEDIVEELLYYEEV